MSIKEDILRLEELMREREIADDGYYLSRQYKEDHRNLYLLKQQQSTKKATHKPPLM